MWKTHPVGQYPAEAKQAELLIVLVFVPASPRGVHDNSDLLCAGAAGRKFMKSEGIHEYLPEVLARPPLNQCRTLRLVPTRAPGRNLRWHIPLKRIRPVPAGASRSGLAMITSVLRPMVILAVLPSLGGCGATVLSAIGPIADAERTILLDSLAIILAILAFAWWFRQGNSRARYLPAWQYSGQLELLVWSVPALVVLFLGGIA